MRINRATYLGLFPTRMRWAQERHLSPRNDLGMHLRPEALWLVRRGTATIATTSGSFQARAGQVLYTAAGLRAQHFAPGTILLSVGIEDRATLASWLHPPGVFVTTPSRRVARLTARLCVRVERLHPQLDPWGNRLLAMATAAPEDWLRLDDLFLRWQIAVLAMARRLGVAVSEPAASGDARVRSVLATIAARPWAPSSSPASLAQAAGISRRRLEQLVRAGTGLGIAELRAHHRLVQAKQLLRTSGAAVKGVAAELGFRSATAFVLWFRRHAGSPPRRWLLAQDI